MTAGAQYKEEGGCNFVVWTPYHKKVSLQLVHKMEQLPMEKTRDGYWKLHVSNVKPGAEYFYTLHDVAHPDPASHYQPKGVFGPSAVVDHEGFAWRDVDWQGVPIREMVMYELHVGTFTPEGTFGGVQSKVKELAELGVNAIELMPVAQFSGTRNWGYDGVFPYAVQDSYGGPEELKRLIEHCHLNGVAVILDVVYNHVGPEGNHLEAFGPYFLNTRKTPWGPAINFDGAESVHVRRFFFENALHWFQNYHLDALRLDAVHAIIDTSPTHFLKELASMVVAYSKKNRRIYLIAESNQNDPNIVRLRKTGGSGLDAEWVDDFHHALHAFLTGEKDGYYVDFGSLTDIVKALRNAFVYSGQYSQFFHEMRGQSSRGISPNKFVVFSQNHDQTGNRALGERLVTLVGLEAAKLGAAVVIMSPYVPMLFMGEEHGETTPFLYFTGFSSPVLAQNVRKGRRKEHAGRQPRVIPDPQEEETFAKSKINWQRRRSNAGEKVLNYYRKLLLLRKGTLSCVDERAGRPKLAVVKDKSTLFMSNVWSDPSMAALANFSHRQSKFPFPFIGNYVKLLDSADSAWSGPGSKLRDSAKYDEAQVMKPLSVALFHKV